MKENKNDWVRMSFLAAIGSLTMMMISCSGEGPGAAMNRPGPANKSDSNLEEVDRSINVKTTLVEQGQLASYLDLSGEVSASSAVDVYGDSAGKLTQILVKQGDRVEQNQIIAWIDPSKPGMNYAASPVKAPLSGTITRINWDKGATVSPQAPLLQIGQLDDLEMTAQVPERFMGRVELGQKAFIASTAYAGELFNAEVQDISPVVNPSSRTLEITLNLEEDSPMKPGMFLGVRLITSTTENSLIVPEESLIRRYDETWVFRVVENQVEKVKVTTGLEADGKVEILSGLNGEDEIVIEGKSLLSPGSTIRIINDLGLTLRLDDSQL